MKDSIIHLDRRFKLLRPLAAEPRPPKGWVRAIRDALGMTAKQLGDRMGVAQPRITEMEKAEISGSITLRSLERAAEALGCRVVYALVPERPLAEMMRKRAEAIATKQFSRIQETMMLEDQLLRDKKLQEGMYEKMIEEVLRNPARLWDEK